VTPGGGLVAPLEGLGVVARHGVGYDYPHDNPKGWIDQQYLPDEQRDKQYYEPSQHGAEADVATRMDERK
jgi:putative ATPase